MTNTTSDQSDSTDHRFNIGDIVVDTEGDSRILIVNTPNDTAEEHIIFEMMPGDPDQTVYTENENAEKDDPVYEAVYIDSLDSSEDTGSWTVDAVLDSYTRGEEHHTGTIDYESVKVFSFPESRLEPDTDLQ